MLQHVLHILTVVLSVLPAVARKEWSTPRRIRPKANIAVTSGWKRKTGQATQLGRPNLLNVFRSETKTGGQGDGGTGAAEGSSACLHRLSNRP